MEINTSRRESENINKQKQEESKSLDNALRNISRNQYPILYELINGINVEHNYKRPDFIRQVVNSNSLIGIEHFSVSFKAIRKDSGKIMSISKIKKHTWEDMKQEVQNKNWLWKLPYAFLATIKHLCNVGIVRYAISYSLAESFQYSLNKHLETVDKYKENLHSISPSSDKKIIFLIDVYLDNPELYIFRPQNYERPQKIKSYEKTIDSALVTVVQSNLQALSHVDWLIFNMYADEDVLPATLCLQTNKDILMQLYDLNYTIYRYIGDDCYDCPDAARAVVLRDIENCNLQDIKTQANMFSGILSIIGAPRQRQREQWAIEKCLEYEQQDVTYACTHLFFQILRQYKQKLKKQTRKNFTEVLRVLRKWKRGTHMRREEILVLANGLYEQALFAQTYFDFIKQYHKFSQSSQYLPEMNFSPCFYQFSYSAWVRALHMELAKMYEDDDNHNTIKKLLGELKNINPEQDFRGSALERFKKDETVYFPISPTDIKLFSPACRQQYIMFGDTASKTIATQISYQECVPFFTRKFRSISRHRESLRENRNQFYAHNSAEIQFDIEKINKNHQMKFENIQALIDYAMQITRFTVGVLTDVSKPTKYAKWYDWEATLILARDGYNFSRQEN